jgi:hypothetical protein
VSTIRSTGPHGRDLRRDHLPPAGDGADLHAIGDEPERADRFRVLAEADAAEPA